MKRKLDIRIVDTAVYEKPEGNVDFLKKNNGKTLYKVTVYLEGSDLSFVENVTYRLHHTFKNNAKLVQRTAQNPNCQMEFWAWGLFTIKARIKTLSGERITISHAMEFDKSLNATVRGIQL